MSIQTPLLYAVVHIARGMTKTHQSTSLACISFHRVKVSLSLRLAVRTMRTMRITEYHFCLRCRVSCSLPSFRTFLDEFSTNQARMNRPSTKPWTKPEEHSTREQVFYQPARSSCSTICILYISLPLRGRSLQESRLTSVRVRDHLLLYAN